MAKHRGIYKRKGSDIWWYRYADLNGKIQRKSSFSTSYKEAETKLRDLKTAIGKGIEPEEQKTLGTMSFNDLADRYLEWIEGTQFSACNKAYTIDRLREREIEFNGQTVKLGVLPLRVFNTHLVEQLQSSLRRQGLNPDRRAGLQDGSLNRVLSTFSHMFTKADEWGLIAETTLKRIRKVKLSKETGRLRYLSAQEAKNLVSVCDESLKPIVICALTTGMRETEILNLKWENVDLVHGFIHLLRTKNGERRDLPINNTLRETLNKIHRDFVEKDGQRELVPHVFHDTKTFKPYSDVRRPFARALKLAGIQDFHFHDLRHTYASLAVMSGEIDIATLSQLLGHKGLKMTMKYAHFAPDYLTKAAHVMDGVLNISTDTELAQSPVISKVTI